MENLYKLGCLRALSHLGLVKSGAFGAKTILPKAMPKAVPEAYEASLKTLGKPGSNPISSINPEGSTAAKYLEALGKPAAEESTTSRWFRKQILEEAEPQMRKEILENAPPVSAPPRIGPDAPTVPPKSK